MFVYTIGDILWLLFLVGGVVWPVAKWIWKNFDEAFPVQEEYKNKESTRILVDPNRRF